MRHFHFVFATASLALWLSGSARADVPPPDTLDCRTAKEGDACSPDGQSADGGTKPGACRKSTCTKLDYANWNKDASASPPSVEYECLKCVLGSDGGATEGPGTGGSSGATGGAGGSTGGTTGATGGTGEGGGGNGGSGTGGASKSSSSGCAVGGSGSALGPWLLAGGFAATIWFARRRR
jgi:hypothetical protein